MGSDAPAPTFSGELVAAKLANLCGLLRRGGVRCGVDRLIAAHRALAEVEPYSSETKAALRCVLCASPRDGAIFEAAYEEVFGRAREEQGEQPLKPEEVEPPPGGDAGGEPEEAAALARGAVDPDVADGQEADQESELDPSPQRWSDREILREKDFRAYTPSDRVRARAEIRRLAEALPTRRSSRRRLVHGAGERLDVPATLRASLRAGGEPFEMAFSSRVTVPRRLVVVCDLSGSMASYSTMLLEYAHAAIQAGRGVEAFGFSTRLARMTPDLRLRDPGRAIARAEERLPDRSGGTRIGAAVSQLNREHGRSLGRGAVVIVVSDGWDRGEPGLLAAEMGRLRRSAHRVIWMDPNSGSPGYEPLTRGMLEAVPEVERLLPAGNLRAVEEMAAVLTDELA